MHRQFRHGARAWDKRMRPTDQPLRLPPSHPFSFSLQCISLILLAIPGCMHTCVQGMRSLSSLFGARLAWSPPPRCHRGATLPLLHVAWAAMPAPVCEWWGAALPYRPCPRHRRTNERANVHTFFLLFCYFLNISFLLISRTVLHFFFLFFSFPLPLSFIIPFSQSISSDLFFRFFYRLPL